MYIVQESLVEPAFIRKDWLDKLGLEQPKTIDDFYNVLKAFKEQDPDGNGANDTYGMIVTDYLDGPLNNIAIWMGAPNQYGLRTASLLLHLCLTNILRHLSS